MGTHLNEDRKFQSDKYPTTPPGLVPLSVTDPTAQDLLMEYAQRRRPVDAEFSADLEAALQEAGYLDPAQASEASPSDLDPTEVAPPERGRRSRRSRTPYLSLRFRAGLRERDEPSLEDDEDDEEDRDAGDGGQTQGVEPPPVSGRLTVAIMLVAAGEFVVAQLDAFAPPDQGFLFHMLLCVALFSLGCLLGRPLDR